MRRWWPQALAALVVLALVFALGRGGRTPTLPRADTAPEQAGAGYTARDVTIEQTDADGRQQYALSAGVVEQQAAGEPIIAHDLMLQYEPENARQSAPQRRWTLRADHAELPEDSSLLALRGGVEARSVVPATGQPLVVRTESLDYDSRAQTLRSVEDVRFQWGPQELRGRGLSADIKAGTLTLESKVHGRIAP